MKIPFSSRKKALVIVDVQPAFITKQNRFVLKNIQQLMKSFEYDLYVESLFYAEKGSMWDRQTHETLPKGNDFYTVPEVFHLLKNKNYIHLEKQTKSVFKGIPNLHSILKKKKILEVHFVGYDTDDCVLTSAEDAFDLGYFTYVIEECTGSSSGKKLHENALQILRNVHLTNNSCVENINFLTFSMLK